MGSSIFREWREMRDFAGDWSPIPVINRAFGGSETTDQLQGEVMDAVVFPHAPRVLVYYCGSNDLNSGATPAEIRDNFKEWCSLSRQNLGPEVRVIFVSINRAPQKRPLWRALDDANALVEAYCRDAPHTRFVDVNGVLFDGAGQPRHDLYREDGLHFHPQAYDEILTVLRGAVEEAWGEAVAGGGPGAAAAAVSGISEASMGVGNSSGGAAVSSVDDQLPPVPPGRRR